MRPSSFAAMLVVTAVMLLAAIVSYASNTRVAQVKVTGAPLVPGLATSATRIAKIEIRQGEKSLVVARGATGTWGLGDRNDYPVKVEAVRALLVKLAEAQLVEPKTNVKERFGLLELEDPTGKDAKSKLLRLLDDKGGVLAETVIGKRRLEAFGNSRSGTYVRRPGDDQTWLASADIEPSLNVRDWVQTSVLELPAAKISKVTIEIPSEKPMQLSRDAAGGAPKFNLVGLPDSKKLKDGASIDAIVRAAAAIELEDVRKADPKATADGGLVTIEVDGGLKVVLSFRKSGEEMWVAIAASGEGDAKAQADDINKRTAGWDFKLPQAKAGTILKREADLVEGS